MPPYHWTTYFVSRACPMSPTHFSGTYSLPLSAFPLSYSLQNFGRFRGSALICGWSGCCFDKDDVCTTWAMDTVCCLLLSSIVTVLVWTPIIRDSLIIRACKVSNACLTMALAEASATVVEAGLTKQTYGTVVKEGTLRIS